jgi:hypothetical protein
MCGHSFRRLHVQLKHNAVCAIVFRDAFRGEFFRKKRPPPTFKKPQKPQLLLFELFVRSEPAQFSCVATHAWTGHNHVASWEVSLL